MNGSGGVLLVVGIHYRSSLNMTANEVHGLLDGVLGAADEDEWRREQVLMILEGAEVLASSWNIWKAGRT